VKCESRAALLAKPEVHDCASRFLPADGGRYISARFFRIPYLIWKELPFMGIEKLCITVGISAFSDHGSLCTNCTRSFIRQNRANGNEPFVLVDRSEIPVETARLASGFADLVD
jgi:hypothetical protein